MITAHVPQSIQYTVSQHLSYVGATIQMYNGFLLSLDKSILGPEPKAFGCWSLEFEFRVYSPARNCESFSSFAT